MGWLSGLMGNASEVDAKGLEAELEPLLVPGETVQKAFKLVRDLLVFTDKRLISIDKQGMTGKKTECLSIPYKSIKYYSKESAGHFDADAELKIWLSGGETPREFQFKKGQSIDEVYRILSQYAL